MNRVHFYITQRDIDEGICRSPGLCPIALALDRRFARMGGDVECIVHPPIIGLQNTKWNLKYKFRMSERLQDWSYNFDKWLEVPQAARPLRFYLDISDKTIERLKE